MPAQPIKARLLRELAILGAIVIPLIAGLASFGLLHVLRLQAARRTSDKLRTLDARKDKPNETPSALVCREPTRNRATSSMGF